MTKIPLEQKKIDQMTLKLKKKKTKITIKPKK